MIWIIMIGFMIVGGIVSSQLKRKFKKKIKRRERSGKFDCQDCKIKVVDLVEILKQYTVFLKTKIVK